MKLSEMSNNTSKRLNEEMQSRVGWQFNLSKMNIPKAQQILESIGTKLSTLRLSHKLHGSEKNQSYVGMVMGQRVLESFISEEIKRLNKSAPKKKFNESKIKEVKMKLNEISGRVKKLRLNEDELSQAQAMLAAKDMVDSLQKMVEDLSEMLNEQLPQLNDSIRASIGGTESDSFNSTASVTIGNVLEAAKGAREELDQAVRTLSGEPATVMAPEPDLDGEMADMDGMDSEIPPPDEEGIDDFDASSPAVGGELPLGREKR